MGGKYKLLEQIIPLFPADIDIFNDVFAGGFNVGANVNARFVFYNDKQYKLTGLMNYLYTHDITDILNIIDCYISKYNLSKTNADGYYHLRKDYNDGRVIQQQLALYTLSCYSFNNYIRFNNRQEFNYAFGKNRSDFNSTMRQHLIDFWKLIRSKQVGFESQDFRNYIKYSSGFLYCDPPYFNSIGSYNERKGWTIQDETDLRNLLVEYKNRFALSNNLKYNDTLLDWCNDNGFKVHYLNNSYSNCSYNKKDKSKDCEILITNY